MTRRRLLRHGLTAAAAGTVGMLALPADPAAAGVDGDVVLGVTNDAGALGTSVQSTGEAAFVGLNTSTGAGLSGVSSGGVGVFGGNDDGSASGVHGHLVDLSGLYAAGYAAGVTGDSLEHPGVVGLSGSKPGVLGRSASAVGVYGTAGGTGTGIGANAEAATAWALRTSGRVHFNRSGAVTVAAGKRSGTSTLAFLPASKSTSVLATIQGGTSSSNAVAAATISTSTGKVTITLLKTAAAATKISFFILD